MSILVRLCLVLLLAACSAQDTLAQDEPEAPPEAEAPEPEAEPEAEPAPATQPYVAPIEMRRYRDPAGRFSFSIPANWRQLASPTVDEAVFQSTAGDTIRVTVSPLRVDMKDFQNAYVETYKTVLDQSFSNVAFVGQRSVSLGSRPATEYTFTATYRNVPVLCHQVVLLAGDSVLYLTYAGFGKATTYGVQVYLATRMDFVFDPAFGTATSAHLSDPNAPAFVLPIPEGWSLETGTGNTHRFRPLGARSTSAFIQASITKVAENSPHTAMSPEFMTAFGARLGANHVEGAFELQAATSVPVGGELGARYDYSYISNFGIRRAVALVCFRQGYFVHVTCDAPEQEYPHLEPAFEKTVADFRFR